MSGGVVVSPTEDDVLVGLVRVRHVAPAAVDDRSAGQDHLVATLVLHLCRKGGREKLAGDHRLGVDGLVAGDDRPVRGDRHDDGAVTERRRDVRQ